MSSKRLRAAVAMVTILSLPLMGSPSQAAKKRVKATSSRTWSPNFVHIPPRSRIVWKNPTGLTHNVTAYGGNWNKSASLPSGTRTRKKFKRKGTFKYRCTLHSTLVNGDCNGMCGVIHVAN